METSNYDIDDQEEVERLSERVVAGDMEYVRETLTRNPELVNVASKVCIELLYVSDYEHLLPVLLGVIYSCFPSPADREVSATSGVLQGNDRLRRRCCSTRQRGRHRSER